MTEYAPGEDFAAAPSTDSGSGSPGLLSTSTALFHQTARPLFSSTWDSIRATLAESDNPWLTAGGLICISSAALNSILGEIWILQPLMRAASTALLDTVEEKTDGGSTGFFGLGGKKEPQAPGAVVSARRSVVLVERNARAIRVAYHVFSTLLAGIGGILIILGRPAGAGSSRDANKEKDMIKVLTGTFTLSAILVTFIGSGHGGYLKAPAFPALGPLAVLMALGLARADRRSDVVLD